MYSYLLWTLCVLAAIEGGYSRKRGRRGKPETPTYTEVEKTDDYEIRKYQPATFVGTSVSGADFKDVKKKMFRKLFRYIKGENDKKTKDSYDSPCFNDHVHGEWKSDGQIRHVVLHAKGISR